MRLAIDAWNLWNDRRGMGRYVRGILAALPEQRDITATLIVRDASKRAEIQHESGLAVVTLREAKRLRFDAVWYPWNGIRFTVPGAARMTTVYDTFAFSAPHPEFIARWREQRPILRALKDSHAVCTISRWSRSEIMQLIPKSDVPVLLAEPTPADFWQPNDALISPQKPYVLTVAGPDARKNIGLAVAAVAQAFPDQAVRFVIAGHVRREDTELLLASRCDYELCTPDDDELRTLYRNALIVLVPSRLEGYGLMVIEAMACGAPVIASDASALPEAADGAALLCSPDDLVAWVAAIRRIAQNPEIRQDFINRGFERVGRIKRTSTAEKTLEAIRIALTRANRVHAKS